MNTDMTLQGRVATVVGAVQGIGKATAEALANLGVHVVVMDRNAEGVHASAMSSRKLTLRLLARLSTSPTASRSGTRWRK